jgi:ribonuclease VapC
LIVVDTSALMAILREEETKDACLAVLASNVEVRVSAGTLVEAYVASEYRGIGGLMVSLVRSLKLEVVPVTSETAEFARLAFQRWGKRRHPATLNFGDCFSYALARQLDCPLLFVGDDFSQTDIQSVL